MIPSTNGDAIACGVEAIHAVRHSPVAKLGCIGPRKCAERLANLHTPLQCGEYELRVALFAGAGTPISQGCAESLAPGMAAWTFFRY